MPASLHSAAGMLLGTYDLAGLHFFLTDPLGTRRVQTDYAGVVEQTCSSLPFGEALQCTLSTAAPTEELFAGLERDDTGLDHAQARQYSSLLGHWTAPDPYDGGLDAGDPQSLNRYAYVNNRPLSMTDPSGLDGDDSGSSDPNNDWLNQLARVLSELFGGTPGHQVVSSGKRPGAHPWDEHGAWKPTQQSLASLLGVPQAGCEFGTCGFQQSGQQPSVSVNCRDVGWGHLGLIFGVQHCDASVSIGDGWLYSISGGPANRRLRGWVSKKHDQTTGGQIYWRGRDSAGLGACLIAAGRASEASKTDVAYNGVLGPNSNNWINGIFASCGVDLGLHSIYIPW